MKAKYISSSSYGWIHTALRNIVMIMLYFKSITENDEKEAIYEMVKDFLTFNMSGWCLLNI